MKLLIKILVGLLLLVGIIFAVASYQNSKEEKRIEKIDSQTDGLVKTYDGYIYKVYDIKKDRLLEEYGNPDYVDMSSYKNLIDYSDSSIIITEYFFDIDSIVKNYDTTNAIHVVRNEYYISGDKIVSKRVCIMNKPMGDENFECKDIETVDLTPVKRFSFQGNKLFIPKAIKKELQGNSSRLKSKEKEE